MAYFSITRGVIDDNDMHSNNPLLLHREALIIPEIYEAEDFSSWNITVVAYILYSSSISSQLWTRGLQQESDLLYASTIGPTPVQYVRQYIELQQFSFNFRTLFPDFLGILQGVSMFLASQPRSSRLFTAAGKSFTYRGSQNYQDRGIFCFGVHVLLCSSYNHPVHFCCWWL